MFLLIFTFLFTYISIINNQTSYLIEKNNSHGKENDSNNW